LAGSHPHKSSLESLLTFLFAPSAISTSLFVAMPKKTTVFPKQNNCWAIGDAFCSDILTLNGAVIPRSTLRPAHDQPLHKNKGQVDGEDFLTPKDSNGTMIQSHDDNGEKDETVPDIEPESLIGYEFIHKIDENGCRAKAIECFPDQKKHMTSIGDGNMESIVSCNEMIDAVNKRMESENDEHDALWFMDSLVDHRLNSD